MPTLFYFSCFFLLTVLHLPTDKHYTASTPANQVVRTFLGIPLTDSVDFIRWKLQLTNGQFILNCNYGVGKPNTNGFYGGGKTIDLNGKFSESTNELVLQNAGKSLHLVELNEDLLQIADHDSRLCIGTGGFSYTLNILLPLHSSHVNLKPGNTVVNDSLVYVGRTPCGVPGVVEPGKECYKLKWKIVFYPISGTSQIGRYKIFGTAYRAQNGKTGTWRVIHGKDDRMIFELNNDKESNYIYLVKLDEHILIFSDDEGKLLVGNEDFSYTLNRVH